MTGMFMMMPTLDFQQSGQPPASSPQPGTTGGGSPTDISIPTLGASLALVPAGATAVAVFPPFETARTVPAIGVIFSEARNMVQTVRRKDVRRLYQHVKKRSLSRFWGR